MDSVATPVQIASLVARNLVPVAGVLFLGWSAPDLLVLYYLVNETPFSQPPICP